MLKHPTKAFLAALLLGICMNPGLALAGTWVVKDDPMGPGYIVTDGETGTIHTQGRKAAEKVAKALNSAGSGFVDSGEGPCSDPKSGVLC